MAKGVKTGGRTKGTPNKATAHAKAAIEEAFEAIGGVNSLASWAEDNRTDFYRSVWVKILPLQVAGDPDNPLKIEAAIEIRPQLSRAEWEKRHVLKK